MEKFTVFPNKSITANGAVSTEFLGLGIHTLVDACRYVHELPYGYNSDRDDLMILFTENMGTCTTKHAVIATLAAELDLPITKAIGIYAMSDAIVTGTNTILKKYGLPYIPMLHCFLKFGDYRIDLTEGNQNGKNRPIEEFLHTEEVTPNISAKDEYILYRQALKDKILIRREFQAIDIRRILHAREDALALLKSKLQP